MAMSGMAATSTVRVQLNNWFLADAKVIGRRPAGWLAARDLANPLSPLGMILGCAGGARRVLAEALKRRQIELTLTEHLLEASVRLAHELETISALPADDYETKIRLRGKSDRLHESVRSSCHDCLWWCGQCAASSRSTSVWGSFSLER